MDAFMVIHLVALALLYAFPNGPASGFGECLQ
jgi:hypothetical protein